MQNFTKARTSGSILFAQGIFAIFRSIVKFLNVSVQPSIVLLINHFLIKKHAIHEN